MKISVGWITRKRCVQFTYSVCSFVQNANNPQNLELLFSIDNDDEETLDAIKQMMPFLNVSGVEVKTLINDRMGYDHMDKYHRNAGKNFTGDCLICSSDDVFCITNGWDDIVRKEVSPYLNEPALIQTQPVEDKHKYWPTMPGITRKWWDITQNIMIYTAGDGYLHEVTEELKLRRIKPNYEVHQISRVYSGRKGWSEVDEVHLQGRSCPDKIKDYLPEPYQKRRGHKEDDGIHTKAKDIEKLMKWKKQNER